MKMHARNQIFYCKFCMKSFAGYDSFKKHEQTHTGEKLYICKVCTKGFNQKAVWVEHIHNHSDTMIKSIGQYKYKCSECKRLFQSLPDLWSHLLKHKDKNTANSKNKPCAFKRDEKKTSKSDSENSEDEPMPVEDKQSSKLSIMNQNDFTLSPTTVAGLDLKSSVQTIKTVDKLNDNKKKQSKKSGQGHQRYITSILENGKRIMKYPIKCNNSSKMPLTANNTSNLGKSEDQLPKDNMDLKRVNIESNHDNEPDLTDHTYTTISNFEHTEQGKVKHNTQNNDKHIIKNDKTHTSVTYNGLIKSDLMFDSIVVNDVYTNNDVNTEPVSKESIPCDLCDEIFENTKELMSHFHSLHFG